jgi:hypothetical protein
MIQQYRYVCSSCGVEGYTCKALFREVQVCHCDYCGELLVLQLNHKTKEFDVNYYHKYSQEILGAKK